MQRKRWLKLMVSLVIALSVASAHTILLKTAAHAVEGPGPIHFAGSALLTLLHVPYKLVTCVAGQAAGGAAYVITAGVPGSYDGGTNGREIGEVASGSCSGAWIVSPKQVQDDYSD